MKIEIGGNVTVNSPGHRQDGRTGTVSYQGRFMDTWGVSIEGHDYGFLPTELMPA